MVDYMSMTVEELQNVRALVDSALEHKKNDRFMRLAAQACETLNELKKQFPYVDYPITVEWNDGFEEVNLFDLVSHFDHNDFSF